MIFEFHTIKEPLSQYVESIFYHQGYQPQQPIERVVPTGHIFLIFEFDGILRSTYDNDTLKQKSTFTKAWISGTHKNYLSISAHQNSDMLVVQFKPFGAYPFLHLPVHKINDQVKPAEEIWGKDILQLRQSMMDESSFKDKFALIEAYLLKRFDVSLIPKNELVSFIQEIAEKAVSEHDQVVANYSMTQKHLISQFKKYCGSTPKTFQRIQRFNEILKRIQNKEHIEWSQVAYTCGYNDQSHFIKEFKAFSGFNPQEFIKQDLNKRLPNFFPVDKKG